jgi:uncharacterized YccA/Bax inhibitor family protein
MADDKEMFKRSGNPTLSPKVFEKAEANAIRGEAVMTVEGTVNKAGLLLLMLSATAGYVVWQGMFQQNQAMLGMAIPALLIGLVLALVIIFKPTTAPYLAPVYAVVEGVVIGALSMIFELKFPGIVVQAAGLTMATLAGMLVLYKTGVIKATPIFKKGMMMAMFAILGMYLVSFVAGLFGANLGFLHDNGLIGMGIAVAITGVAALSLILDFDMIEQGAKSGAPKFMEWYGGFALMVTLIWLYIRILDLLSRLRSK